VSARATRPDDFGGFPAAGFTFLRGLKRHNDRAWFEEHRDRFELGVRAPMAALVDELDIRLATIAPELVGDPKKSVFRVHRDVRFSKDKSPYKTFLACWLFHRDQGRSAAMRAHGGSAGIYVHFEPGASFVAGGMWMPPSSTLARVRAALVKDLEGFERAVASGAFVARYGGLTDEGVLTRAPRAFPDAGPAARWLRHRSFMARRPLDDAAMRDAALPDILGDDLVALAPLVRWLNAALGYRAAGRR
jgi:uncharacterized protein (TIGR02453 family)